MSVIKRVSYNSLNEGKHFVIFGAVHGNEICGPIAINRIIDDIDNHKISIKKGRVTFIPIANPKAHKMNVRFVERNLNRHMYPKDEPVHYEDHIDPILCDVLNNADVLLDLHSYQSQGGPFCFFGQSSQAEIDFARSLGIKHFVYGWSEAFSSSQKKDDLASMGTTEYVRHQGGFATTTTSYARSKNKKGIAVTVECGNHLNDDAADVGYETIKRALAFLDMIDYDAPKSDEKQYCIKMKSVFYKEKAGQFTKPWKHCDRVQKNDLIATYDDGEELRAPDDGFLVLPKAATDQPEGSEWFYFGVETDFPAVKGK